MTVILAGKPPYATDDPDSLFENLPKHVPRARLKPVDDTAPGGARESAYNTLDAYFDENDPRASGIGDIGRGLMNAGSDYDDSSDEEGDIAVRRPVPSQNAPAAAAATPADKHRALFEAAVGSVKSDSSPLHNATPPSFPPGVPAPNVDPAPAYEIRQHENSVPSPHQSIQSLGGPPPPAALRTGIHSVVAPAPRPPQPAFMQQSLVNMTPSPSPSYAISLPGTPGPQMLPPPQTPIVPVFARPKDDRSIKYDEKVHILRGESEETFLPRGRGGKADDFWRRFSMVAREDAKSNTKSAWLRKTQSGTTRLATWVWLVGILILLVIGGAIGVGWFFTHNKPAGQPIAIGGSASETVNPSSPAAPTPVKPTLSAPLFTASTSPDKRFFTDIVAPSHVPRNIQRKSLINRIQS